MKRISTEKNITDRSNQVFNLYLKDIAKIPLISKEEEEKLWPLIKEGNEKARNRIIEGNLRFVITCAKHFQGQGLELNDLVSEGTRGLIKSISKYDPEKGVKFISYAVNWIEQSIIEALSCTSRTIRLPVSHLNARRKIFKASNKIEQEEEREASILEISEITGIDEHKISKNLGVNESCSSLDASFENSHDDATCLLDIVPSNFSFADEHLINTDNRKQIDNALNKLSTRSRCIIKMFFGIDVNPITLEEIGDYFGLTSERVRQLKDEALLNMRKYFKVYEKNYISSRN